MTAETRLGPCVALLALVWLSSSSAQTIELVERAREVALGDVTFPASDAGTLRFRACGTCALENLALTADTRYSVAGSVLTRRAFLERVDELRSRTDAATVPVTIFHRTGTREVTRIALHAKSD